MTGCATRYIEVSVDWPGLSIGEHPFWVEIDSPDTITESNEGDNVTTGLVRVLSGGLFLPTLMR
jgi:hypothetical protein